LRRVVEVQLERLDLKPRQRVGLGVGSRGIRHIERFVETLVAVLKQRGLEPFIIPAMGSHGGATPEGQIETLRTLGISAERCGCPLRSSFDSDPIGTVFGEVPVHYSRDAAQADHVICINRIKPHTKFKAPLESGVLKMLCVGLGKHQGALAYHRWALKHGFYPLLLEMGRLVLARSNFRFGIGIVENAYDETLRIEGLAGAELIEREKDLLELAKIRMPRLPVREADVLVVGRIGKDINGAGMDPNITGRAVDLKEDDFSAAFRATRLAILNLTAATKGNALGMGNADFITRKVLDALDYQTTLMNILTSVSIRKAAIPVVMPTDEKAIQACFTTIGPLPPAEVRALIIRDTLHLADCWVSRAVFEELEGRADIVSAVETPLTFDADGNLTLLAAEGSA